MLYSVYNWNTKKYDYYESNRSSSRSLPSYRELGASPNEVVAELPSDAKLIGTGEEAKGAIATNDKPKSSKMLWIVGGLVIALFVAPKFLRD